jgi:hypothetical protein
VEILKRRAESRRKKSNTHTRRQCHESETFLGKASAYCMFSAAFEILYAGVGNENLPVRAIEPIVDELGKANH